MSINIHFIGYRDIMVVKTGKTEIQTCKFDGVLQTPSDVTNRIMKAENPFQEYVDWVLAKFDRIETEPVYADDDIFNEREPVGYEEFNFGREHINDFHEWLDFSTKAGYNIMPEAW